MSHTDPNTQSFPPSSPGTIFICGIPKLVKEFTNIQEKVMYLID